MKRLPLLFTLLALIALSASAAYWVLQLYQPAQRPLAAAPPSAAPEPSADAAASLFGGQAAAVVATNYQLTGVVAAGRDSVAILVADGSPPKALKLGKEVVSGVTVQEVHPRYVMLSEGGVLKRIELAAEAKPNDSAAPPGPGAPQQMPQRQMPQQQAMPQQPVQQPAPPQPMPQAQPNVQGQISPGPLHAAPQPQQQAPPPVQMPPPTRAVGGPQPAPVNQ
jgi:general secretion pathway protein C